MKTTAAFSQPAGVAQAAPIVALASDADSDGHAALIRARAFADIHTGV